MIWGLSYAQLGAMLVFASLILLWLRIFKRARAVMVFLGLMLLGNSLLVRLLVDIVRWLATLFGDLFAKVFGVAVPGILGLTAIGLLIYDLHPKGGGASRRTYWLAVLSAIILVAGLAGYAALNGIPSDVQTGVSTVSGG